MGAFVFIGVAEKLRGSRASHGPGMVPRVKIAPAMSTAVTYTCTAHYAHNRHHTAPSTILMYVTFDVTYAHK